MILGTLLIAGSWTTGLYEPSESLAQQPPAWSPQVYVAPRKLSDSTTVPNNALRDSSNQAKKISDASNVARWKTPAQAVGSGTTKSFAQSIPIEVKPAVHQTEASSSKVQLASHSAPAEAMEPRSSFELNQVLQRTVQSTPMKSPERHISSKPTTSAPETDGIWRDRNENRSIQQARYQEPKSLLLPPAQDNRQDAPSKGLLDNPALPGRTTEPESLPLNDSTSRQNKSVPEQEPFVPNPFPGTRRPEARPDESPSDEMEPPPMRGRDDDLAPPPPKRTDRTLGDCDALRARALSTDIRKIRVDSSPDFVEGIQEAKKTSKNTKEDFVANAPSRNWYDHNGQLVAQGKLVDLEFGLAIIERADGMRTSFNMRKLSDYDQAYIAQSWSIPMTCSIDDGSFPSRDFSETTMTWKASGTCHKPLYFEDAQLERYGHEWGPFAQPVISTLHFFGNVAVLPYKMGIHPMNECQYSLGHYRPGSCAPWTVGPVPLSLRGAAMQAKFVTGAAWALP